jgi:hypothetical protein
MCASRVFTHETKRVIPRFAWLCVYESLRTVQVYTDLIGDSFPRRFAFPCESRRRLGDSHLVEIRRFAVRYLPRTRIQDSLLRFRKIRYLGFCRLYT